jgi:hypothetical protein
MIDTVRSAILASDDLGHMFEATLMLAFLAPFLVFAWFRLSRHAFWVYPIFVFAWYHGREKAQFELALKKELGLRSVIPLWSEGIWPWEWSRDAILDLAVPTVYATVLAFVLTLAFARMFSHRSLARRVRRRQTRRETV